MPLASYVMFVDILGFADLVLASGDAAVAQLTPSIRPEVHLQLASSIVLHQSPALERIFGFFHQTIEEFLPRVHQGMGGASLVFSDCAFLQVRGADQLGNIAIAMMRDLIAKRVPVRMGLASGELRVLRFQSDSYMLNVSHSTQFLGAGVVKANRTEGCGAQGLRILVDPDVEPDLLAAKVPLVSLPTLPPRWPVAKEVNYVLSSSEYATTNYQVFTGAYKTVDAYEDFMMTNRIAEMRALAPPNKQAIYDETAVALTNMRAQYGRPGVRFS